MKKALKSEIVHKTLMVILDVLAIVKALKELFF